MSFFYDLNKRLNGLSAETKQIAESVEKAAAEVKTPARVTLEESLKQDMKSLMEGSKPDFLDMDKDGNKKEPMKKAVADKKKNPFAKEKVEEDGTGGQNFSGSGSLEEKSGTPSYSAKKAAAGKDIGKPGKNFAKIEKSAGGGEKGKKIAGAVLAKLRAAKESVEEASMEMEAGAGGIHGNMPDPMTQKDQQKKMNPPQSLEEKDAEGEEDIIAYLNRKLAPHDAAQQAKEDSCAVPYNAGSGRPDAKNGMEFEGNAFTGKLASTPKGGKFELGGEEHTDTSSLEETVSRKHFQQVADLLKNIPDPEKRRELAMHHASIFKQQNPRFDIRRFGQACDCDLEECAMWEDLKGGQHKLDVDHDGDIGADDLAALRAGKEVTDEGWADMDAWLAQREKEKGTGKFDSRKTSTGTVYTRKPETFAGDDEEGGEPAVKRGRGRPAVAKKPERVTGKAWKHKGGRMQEEEQEVDEEKAEAGKRHFFDKLAPAAKKVAKVVAKVAGNKQEVDEKKESTGKEDKKAEKAGKKVAKDIEHDEGHKGKDDDKAEKAGKKVTKDIEYDDKKDRKEKKADDKEEKVEETTTSGSVATASTGKKSNAMGIGQGIYDSWEREFDRLLNEAVTVKQESMMDEHMADGDEDAITITATGDDVAKLKAALQSMGVSHGAAAPAEPHGEEPCHSCGGVPCQCDDMGAEGGLPGEIEIEVVEADAPVSQNSPDYPSNQEYSDDALQYSGGLNKPKATGQTTIPVIASQEERQVAEDQRFFSLVKSILLK